MSCADNIVCSFIAGGGSSKKRAIKSAGEKKTNTPVSVEGDKQVSIENICLYFR
jgi:hypothetical protein